MTMTHSDFKSPIGKCPVETMSHNTFLDMKTGNGSLHTNSSHVILVSVQGTVDLWSYIMPIVKYSHTL